MASPGEGILLESVVILSPGHLKTHPEKYKNDVTAFLSDGVGLFKLRMADTSHGGFQSPRINGSVSGSVTSSSNIYGQKMFLRNHNPLSKRLESQSSPSTSIRVLIPSRM